jgi:hypothetical protein
MRTGAGKQLIGPSSAMTLQGVRDAVDTDLRNYTASGAPDVQQAADMADSYYASRRVPFKAADIAKAGAPNLAGTSMDAESDRIFGNFIQAGRGDKAQRFFDRLDPRGRGAVQYQMAADAMNQATDPIRGTFDPAKFYNALNKTQDAYGVFFTGPDKAAMDGLKKLAQQAVMASDQEAARAKNLMSTARAATGSAVPFALAGMHPVAGGLATLGAFAGAARGLMETDWGRRLLADASNLTPGSPALARLYETATKQLPATAARAATQAQ